MDSKEIIEMKKNNKHSPKEDLFFEEVKTILADARVQTFRTVNSIMVETYWRIGRRIVEEEQQGKDRANYGDYLITNLSRYLGMQFGKGFSVANLKNFRHFYLVFQENSIGYTLCSLLSWSHIRLIMRLDSEKAREYYLKEAREQNWSVRVLERNIKTQYFERLLSSSSHNSDSPPDDSSPLHFVKDPYVLEFLGLEESIQGKENKLENAIITNLQKFLLEMGKGFSFVGRQFRISSETSHFYIDLVFYNYLLKCFIIIDLKTNKLTHQDIGQMDMYVRMFDDLKRGNDDNPTIGIILCADKDETIVKYSVLKENQQLFASRYKLILPTEEELISELEREREALKEAGELV